MRALIDMLFVGGGGNRVAVFFVAAFAVGAIVKMLVR